MVLNCHWQRAEVKKLFCAVGVFCAFAFRFPFMRSLLCSTTPHHIAHVFPPGSPVDLRFLFYFFLYNFSLISLSFFSTSLPIAAIPPGKNTSLLLPTHPHTTTNTIVKNDPLAWALTSEYLRNHGACHGWLHLSPVWRLIVRLSCVLLDFISSRQASRNKLAIRDFRVGEL
ncbi:hypothetical protein BP00DRAFT_43595 [Aspergillus indologenus CBS 114.80]|uniref:Uncharacterized protein n=1 Tax=Aspergillus indologenus CBS 114.80 TaxID=1450541 RepID=A0A2V5HXT8_9EURO|nr:hypothetical protein BP00DRAFT_43595 [Aspergillus indologenus CBS 114.80]